VAVAQVLAWADAYHGRTGEWPTARSGPVPEAPGCTWAGLNRALQVGRRGLPGGDSLARLLRRERGVPDRRGRPTRLDRRRLAATLLAGGLTRKQIAEKLRVSPQRVCQLLRDMALKGLADSRRP
jgi:hypothetical protein